MADWCGTEQAIKQEDEVTLDLPEVLAMKTEDHVKDDPEVRSDPDIKDHPEVTDDLGVTGSPEVNGSMFRSMLTGDAEVIQGTALLDNIKESVDHRGARVTRSQCGVTEHNSPAHRAPKDAAPPRRRKQRYTYITATPARLGTRTAKRKSCFKVGYELTRQCGGQILIVYVDDKQNSTTFTNSDALWARLTEPGGGLRLGQEGLLGRCKRVEMYVDDPEQPPRERVCDVIQRERTRKRRKEQPAPISTHGPDSDGTQDIDSDHNSSSEMASPTHPSLVTQESQISEPVENSQPALSSLISPPCQEPDLDPSTQLLTSSLIADEELPPSPDEGSLYEPGSPDEPASPSSTQGEPARGLECDTTHRPLMCTVCRVVFEKPRDLEAHIKHHEDKMARGCALCGKSFTQYSKLRHHIIRTHPDVKMPRQKKPYQRKKIYKCPVCDQEFDVRSEKDAHVKTHQQTNFICNVCGRSFKQLRNLNRHIAAHSKVREVKQYKCKICDKMLKNNSSLKDHLQRHAGVKEQLCTICGKAFFTRVSLRRHIETHSTETPHKCHLCGKYLKTIINLNLHLKIHSGIKPYKCDECEKTFVSHTGLSLHKKSHAPRVNSFLCSICGKGFADKGKLNRHAVVHTGDKPYKCPVCQKGFPQACYIKPHVSRVHGTQAMSEYDPGQALS